MSKGIKEVVLKDGREVTVRSLALDDKERLVEMFASLSDEALKWGLPPLKLYRKFGSEVHKTSFYIIAPFRTIVHESKLA
jgi:hypothetical protein